MLQDLGSDHLPILLSVPLSTVFRPNERPPSFNFQKARWDDFVSYLYFHCPSAEEYSSSLSSAAALFISLALNAAKSSIPFGRTKCHPKAWWSAEMEDAVTEKCKAFAAAHRSDEDCQAEAWQTTCSSLSPKQTQKLYTLLSALSLARLFPLLISQTVLLPGNRLRSTPLT